jgi:hypothetical protein
MSRWTFLARAADGIEGREQIRTWCEVDGTIKSRWIDGFAGTGDGWGASLHSRKWRPI